MSKDIRTFDVTEQIHINSAPDAVWNLLTTRTAEWWLEPYRLFDNNDTMTLDLKPGGLLMEETADGETGVWGHITRMKPGEMIEFSGSCGMNFAVYGTFTFTVVKADEGTSVTIHHVAMGPMGERQGAGYHQGWKTMMGNLKSLAES